MKFLVIGHGQPHDIGILDKISQLELDNTLSDKEKYKSLTGEEEGYESFVDAVHTAVDDFIEIHENMVLTENGAYVAIIRHKDEVPKEMANKKLYFLKNGKLVHEYAENMDLKTPVLDFVPIAPYYEDESDGKRLEKFKYKFDLKKIDLRKLYLFKTVILDNFAVVETEEDIFCISLKGNSRVQNLRGLRLYGKIRDKPLLVTTHRNMNFLIELRDTLKLIKIFKE